MEEIWKDIPGYEGYYQASNLGNIKSIKRIKYVPSLNKKIDINKEKILKAAIDKHGYKVVVLTNYKYRKTFKVHRLIINTFKSNDNNYKCINHIDGNKLNNHINNLEWCTYSFNTKHAYDNFLISKSNKYKKVNQFDLRGKFLKQWNSMKEAGLELGIHPQNISMCCRKIRNKTGNYIWRYADDSAL